MFPIYWTIHEYLLSTYPVATKCLTHLHWVVSSYLGIWVFHKVRQMQTLRLHNSWAVMLEVALLETEISTKTWHELNLVPSCCPLQTLELTCMKLVLLWSSNAWRSFTRSESWEFLFSSLWVFGMFFSFFGEFCKSCESKQMFSVVVKFLLQESRSWREGHPTKTKIWFLIARLYEQQ